MGNSTPVQAAEMPLILCSVTELWPPLGKLWLKGALIWSLVVQLTLKRGKAGGAAPMQVEHVLAVRSSHLPAQGLGPACFETTVLEGFTQRQDRTPCFDF